MKTVSLVVAAAMMIPTGLIAQQQSNPPAGGQGAAGSATQAPASNGPKRVRTKYDGFEQAPQVSANQIGGASRGIGGTKAYAPNKGKVYSLTPTFEWSGSPTAMYKFHLDDVRGQTIVDIDLKGTTYTYPIDAPPLEPGKTYVWRVRPDNDMLGGPTAPASFVVVGGDERKEISEALSKSSGEDAEAAKAKVFFDKRVWYDAVTAYSDLIAQHPDDSKLYLMRGSLYDQVSSTEKLADMDFAKVKQ